MLQKFLYILKEEISIKFEFLIDDYLKTSNF